VEEYMGGLGCGIDGELRMIGVVEQNIEGD
jgi:hypothetical protein